MVVSTVSRGCSLGTLGIVGPRDEKAAEQYHNSRGNESSKVRQKLAAKRTEEVTDLLMRTVAANEAEVSSGSRRTRRLLGVYIGGPLSDCGERGPRP
jgi:hypothetical protein